MKTVQIKLGLFNKYSYIDDLHLESSSFTCNNIPLYWKIKYSRAFSYIDNIKEDIIT